MSCPGEAILVGTLCYMGTYWSYRWVREYFERIRIRHIHISITLCIHYGTYELTKPVCVCVCVYPRISIFDGAHCPRGDIFQVFTEWENILGTLGLRHILIIFIHSLLLRIMPKWSSPRSQCVCVSLWLWFTDSN